MLCFIFFSRLQDNSTFDQLCHQFDTPELGRGKKLTGILLHPNKYFSNYLACADLTRVFPYSRLLSVMITLNGKWIKYSISRGMDIFKETECFS